MTGVSQPIAGSQNSRVDLAEYITCIHHVEEYVRSILRVVVKEAILDMTLLPRDKIRSSGSPLITRLDSSLTLHPTETFPPAHQGHRNASLTADPRLSFNLHSLHSQLPPLSSHTILHNGTNTHNPHNRLPRFRQNHSPPKPHPTIKGPQPRLQARPPQKRIWRCSHRLPTRLYKRHLRGARNARWMHMLQSRR